MVEAMLGIWLFLLTAAAGFLCGRHGRRRGQPEKRRTRAPSETVDMSWQELLRLEHVETAGVRLGGHDIALPVPCHGHKRVIVRLFIPEHRSDRLIDHAGDAPLRLRFAVLRQKRQQLPIEKNEREKQQCRRAEEYQPSAMTATHRPFQSDPPYYEHHMREGLSAYRRR